jgi:RecG-like helicase
MKSLGQRLRASVQELERTRLVERFGGLGLTSIADLAARQPVRIGGEIHRVVIAPRHGVHNLEVVVSDGTGSITAVFTGRRSIMGVEHGRAVILEGVAVPERDRNVMFNPAYTLIGPGKAH